MTPALGVHVSAGLIAIAAGAVAIAARKGGPLHRRAGDAFTAGMLVMGLTAAGIAAGMRRPDLVMGGILAAYLVASGWQAGRRPAGEAGRLERALAAVAAGAALADVGLALMALASPKGAFAGAGPGSYLVSAGLAALFCRADLSVIRRGGLSGAPRLRRHVWRMCLGLFVATGSFFLGQQKVMPEAWRGLAVWWVVALAPLVLMGWWLVRLRVRKPPAAAAAA